MDLIAILTHDFLYFIVINLIKFLIEFPNSVKKEWGMQNHNLVRDLI